jgi:hypothetical protein
MNQERPTQIRCDERETSEAKIANEREHHGRRGMSKLEYTVVLLIVALTAALLLPDLPGEMERFISNVAARLTSSY